MRTAFRRMNQPVSPPKKIGSIVQYGSIMNNESIWFNSIWFNNESIWFNQNNGSNRFHPQDMNPEEPGSSLPIFGWKCLGSAPPLRTRMIYWALVVMARHRVETPLLDDVGGFDKVLVFNG